MGRRVVTGRPRAGFIGDKALIAPGVETIDVTDAGTSYFALNHDVYASNPVLVEDMQRILKDRQHPPDQRTGAFEPVAANDGTYWRYHRAEVKAAAPLPESERVPSAPPPIVQTPSPVVAIPPPPAVMPRSIGAARRACTFIRRRSANGGSPANRRESAGRGNGVSRTWHGQRNRDDPAPGRAEIRGVPGYGPSRGRAAGIHRLQRPRRHPRPARRRRPQRNPRIAGESGTSIPTGIRKSCSEAARRCTSKKTKPRRSGALSLLAAGVFRRQ